jgi:hypothetical protein
MRIIRPRCLSPQPVRKESITKDSEVQVKNGALKPLKQRKSARHLQRRMERQRPESKVERRTRKAQRQADYIASKARVDETMKPEKERQARKKLFERLRWLSRFPATKAYEDVVQIEGGKLMKTWDNERGGSYSPQESYGQAWQDAPKGSGEEIRIEQELFPVVNPAWLETRDALTGERGFRETTTTTSDDPTDESRTSTMVGDEPAAN